MGIDALRTMALEVTFNVLGVAVSLTRPVPNDVAIETTGVWQEPLDEEQPYGHDLRRLDARKVMAVTRTSDLNDLPAGTIITAPELEDGDVLTWRVEGYDGPVEPDLMRVILVRIADGQLS